MKKFLSVVLSVCMVLMCSVSAFAYTTDAASKTVISDQEMAVAVGGCTGNVNADVTSYDSTTGVVNVSFTNDLTLLYSGGVTKYSLENINPQYGTVTQVLIPANDAPAGLFNVSATSACVGPNPGSGCTVRASIWNENPSSPGENYCAAVTAQSVRLAN